MKEHGKFPAACIRSSAWKWGILLFSLLLMIPVGAYGLASLASQEKDIVSSNDLPSESFLDGESRYGWTSSEAGDHISVLLDKNTTINAEFVYCTTPGATYRLLGSTNYRDWYILSEGEGAVNVGDRLPILFEPFNARFLRLESCVPGETNWQLFAGTETELMARFGTLEPVDWGDITDPAVIYPMLDLAFSWQVANQAVRQDGLGWMNGAFHAGISALYQATRDTKYRQAIIDRGEFGNWTLRNRGDLYHADDHCLGQAWLELYLVDENPQDVWIADVKYRIDSVMTHPHAGRTDFWWCDSLFMSPPLYGRLAEITGNAAYQTFIDGQFWDCVDYLYDEQYHLFYRDSSYFGEKEANGKPVFWSRGNGWVMAGIARMLQYMPLDWSERPQYESLLGEMASALASIQDADTGMWTSSLLYPEKYDNEPETSGSAFYTYAIAYGVNEGILNKTAYGPVIEEAWAGLTSMLRPDGQLLNIQQGGAGPADNNMDSLKKDFGYGAFLLAGVEVIRYYSQQPAGQKAYSTLESGMEFTATSPVGDLDSWQLVDDFENGYDWKVEANDENVPYVETGAYSNDDNASLVFWVPFPGNGCFFCDPVNVVHTETPMPPIQVGSIGTLYERLAFENPMIGFIRHPQLWMLDLKIHRLSHGEDFLELETWYERWTVVDYERNHFEIYIRGGSNFPEITQIGDASFEDSEPFELYEMSLMGNLTGGSSYLDDICVDPTGRNLTRPPGVRQPVYSPWSHVGRERDTLIKDTDIGPLWDLDFPWIYHHDLQWVYIWPQERYPGGYYAWIRNNGHWTWISSIWPGWYYDFTTGEWRIMSLD